MSNSVVKVHLFRRYFAAALCRLQHQAHALKASAVFGAGGAYVDAGSVDAAVTQQIGQLGQVLVQAVERPGKQVAEVVGEYLLVGDPGARQRAFISRQMLLRSSGAPLRVTNTGP